MKRTNWTVVFLVLAALMIAAMAMMGCSLFKTGCANLTGIPLTACEVQNFVTDIEAAVPPAFATIDLYKGAFNASIQARVASVESAWPPLKVNLDGLSTAIAAGQQANWFAVLGDGLAFYVELGAVYSEVYVGHSLPGMPSAPPVQKAVTATKPAVVK